MSLPSSVVRSIIRTARVRASIFESFLIDLVEREATRSVTPTSSTLATDLMNEARVGGGDPPGQRWKRGARCRCLRYLHVQVLPEPLPPMVGRARIQETRIEMAADP